jgi:hypothetical protein
LAAIRLLPKKLIFAAAYREFLKRLKNSKCAALFGGTDAINNALARSNFEVADLGRPKEATGGGYSLSPATTARRVGDTIVLNSFGDFFVQNHKLNGPDGQTYSVPINKVNGLLPSNLGVVSFRSDVLSAVHTLLHELTHLTGQFGPDSLADDPEETRRRQAAVNDAVLNACF